MGDRPPAALLAELGMALFNRLVLVRLRRLIVGEDGWTDFYASGHDGHPWWHYQEGPDGRLSLVGPLGSRARPALPQPPRAPLRPKPMAGGLAVALTCGRVTTPIAGYQPGTHAALVDQLDLLCTLLDGGGTSTVADSSHHPRLSPSLAARAWGTRTGRSQRRADAYLADLGAAGILVRAAVGSRTEWHVPPDALERFRAAHGFTVAD